MITNTGQSILAKYLVGQAPAYASYIAIGCGATPVLSSHVFSEAETNTMKEKESLDFEMFRIPVTSRGYVTEEGVSKIVFTGELPTLERYDITEVGIWSAGSNPSANFNDSRTIFLFTKDENWEYHEQTQASSIETYEDDLHSGDNVINKTEVVFQTNSDNPIFAKPKRKARKEGCRFLNNIIAIRGDMSTINVLPSGKLEIASGSNHIHLTGSVLDFDKASPKDELRLAFSLINKNGDSDVQPDEVRIMIEFAETDVHDAEEGQWARFETVLLDSDLDVDFATGRYFVSTKKFEELTKSPGFTWKTVDVAKFYVSVIKNEVVSSDYYVCLDALRLENTTNQNPIYGLTGYSIVKNLDLQPITKIANSSSHIEFRFGLDVL
jgi:hypothetical protein